MAAEVLVASVSFEVVHQSVLLDERPAADAALEGLLPCMNFDVAGKILALGKLFAADRTHVRLLPRVGRHVLVECALQHESLVANEARIRSFPGMTLEVSVEVRPATKSLGTNPAGVTDFLVSFHVHFEPEARGKVQPADATGKRFVSSMRFHVIGKGVLTGELLRTDFTHRFLIGVRVHVPP